MKIKLWKKVKKRYSLYWHPNGIKQFDLYHKLPCFMIEDKKGKKYLPFFVGEDILTENLFGKHRVCKSKEEAYRKTLDHLEAIIKTEYSKYGTRRIALKNKKEKLWP